MIPAPPKGVVVRSISSGFLGRITDRRVGKRRSAVRVTNTVGQHLWIGTDDMHIIGRMTAKEAQQRLGVPAATIRTWRRRRELVPTEITRDGQGLFSAHEIWMVVSGQE